MMRECNHPDCDVKVNIFEGMYYNGRVNFHNATSRLSADWQACSVEHIEGAITHRLNVELSIAIRHAGQGSST
jgi:hypothetical protein